MMGHFRTFTVGVLAAAVGFGIWVRGQQADTRPLSTLVPAGAVLYLEAQDFRALLDRWNHSAEKASWLTSDNYSVMAESRLIQRLSEAQEEFISVAGFPVGMNLLDEVAGERSAIAFYDVSYNFSFVYLTQLPQNRLEGTDLWRGRSGYQPREVAGVPFYVKTGGAGNGTRTVSFAAFKGWLVLATDESRMADTLRLLAGNERRSLAVDPWFKEAENERPEPGDLKLVYNLSALVATPQFRTYWIQRNASELKQFAAGVSVLHSRPDAFEEERVLLRKTPDSAMSDSPIEDVLHYAPHASSLYRAWAVPDADKLRDVIRQVLIGEHVVMQNFNAPAPTVTPEAGAVGSESDLEIRIDEPLFQRVRGDSIQPVLDAIVAMQPTALLHVQTTTVLHDQVFVLPGSGLVVLCKKPDRAFLDAALAQISGQVIGGDLDPLAVRVDGEAVILSRIPLTRQTRTDLAVTGATTEVAVYNHSLEWPHYRQLFSLLDSGPAANPGFGQPSGPGFFSGNVQSLGDSLSRLNRISITTSDHGTKISELAEYRVPVSRQ